MPTIRVHKIASVASRLGLGSRQVEISDGVPAEIGAVVVVRALREKRVYNDLELDSGRMTKITRGNVIVGALGRRRALRGFCGEIPERVEVGDRLHLLNMGGVIGFSPTAHIELGPPAEVEVLGAVVRDGRPLNVRDSVISAVESLASIDVPPIVMISGTCMNSGKTFACTRIIQNLSRRGLTVHAGKLSGIACLRDSIAMEDHGAARTASFLDAGVPSTAGLPSAEMVRVATTIIGHLAEGRPDAIFLELGDGIIGDYGVMAVLDCEEIARHVAVHLFCAGDLVGAWGGHAFLAGHGVDVHIFSGPVTDTPVGVEYVERELGRPAVNARLDPERLANLVAELLGVDSETTVKGGP